MSQDKPINEPFSGSPDISALVERLKQRARDRVAIALFAIPPLKVEEQDEWIAAQALRALEAELDKLRKA